MYRDTTRYPAHLNRPARRYQGDGATQAVHMWGTARRAAAARSGQPIHTPPPTPRAIPDPETTLPLFIPTRPPGTSAAVL
jgi:hypothetical protein